MCACTCDLLCVGLCYGHYLSIVFLTIQMRALRDFNKEQRTELPTMGLRISMKNIALFAGDGSQVVMRHSTTRVAYSTVDAEHPKTFAYVAVVKGTNLALCHVFNTKSKKQGYEMTFACAQAFDLNLQCVMISFLFVSHGGSWLRQRKYTVVLSQLHHRILLDHCEKCSELSQSLPFLQCIFLWLSTVWLASAQKSRSQALRSRLCRYWSTHKAEALAEAEKSEKTDIQPPEAWQRKKDDVPHHLVVPSRDESNESISELASSSGGLNYVGFEFEMQTLFLLASRCNRIVNYVGLGCVRFTYAVRLLLLPVVDGYSLAL